MKKLNYFLILSFVIAFSNCKNDPKVEKPIEPPTAAAFQSMQQDFLSSITQTKTLNTDSTFTSKKGVKVRFSYLTDSNGQPITGAVQLKYVEMFDIGTIAFGNKPLIGRNWNGERAALVTGGEFFVEAKQNGKDLDGYVMMEVPAALTKNPDSIANNMQAWAWDNDSIEWAMGKGEMGRDGDAAAGYIYHCWFPFNWTNIDWLYSLEGEKTPICVKVPEGFNNKNSVVYAAYVGMPNTLAPFDVYVSEGAGSPYFTEHTGIAPVGYRMHIIFISASQTSGQAIYAIKTVTLVKNEYIYINQSDLRAVSIQDVINAINGLYSLN